MNAWTWSTLHHLEVARFGEDFARMQFAMFSWRTYEPYADNHAVDFVAKHPDGRAVSVQVKAVRDRNYAFIRKQDIVDLDSTWLSLVLLDEGEPPRLFVIPLLEWRQPNTLLADRDYAEKKSAPEYGIQSGRSNQEFLEQYAVPGCLL